MLVIYILGKSAPLSSVQFSCSGTSQCEGISSLTKNYCGELERYHISILEESNFSDIVFRETNVWDVDPAVASQNALYIQTLHYVYAASSCRSCLKKFGTLIFLRLREHESLFSLLIDHHHDLVMLECKHRRRCYDIVIISKRKSIFHHLRSDEFGNDSRNQVIMDTLSGSEKLCGIAHMSKTIAHYDRIFSIGGTNVIAYSNKSTLFWATKKEKKAVQNLIVRSKKVKLYSETECEYLRHSLKYQAAEVRRCAWISFGSLYFKRCVACVIVRTKLLGIVKTSPYSALIYYSSHDSDEMIIDRCSYPRHICNTESISPIDVCVIYVLGLVIEIRCIEAKTRRQENAVGIVRFIISGAWTVYYLCKKLSFKKFAPFVSISHL